MNTVNSRDTFLSFFENFHQKIADIKLINISDILLRFYFLIINVFYYYCLTIFTYVTSLT